MNNQEVPPAFFFRCACDTKDCPNQILWINKSKLSYGDCPDEVCGCIPISSFTPEEMDLLYKTTHLQSKNNEQ